MFFLEKVQQSGNDVSFSTPLLENYQILTHFYEIYIPRPQTPETHLSDVEAKSAKNSHFSSF